ncbi:hypothetical protein CCZ01_06650 [Helicobacter monodelphidis]|uniref:phosphatidylserine decarboxylase n=1 Tax=Helicobacter sp. 15-1451 TaxID=2004995 RepID=UPI000DCB5A60|nr:phosphatidylserine decarboxylase [Helicobacter sp. 15-1451]RAX57252.1 hypothetical protein CCZ01_06650 [Helicobacter sp. 15-1451]
MTKNRHSRHSFVIIDGGMKFIVAFSVVLLLAIFCYSLFFVFLAVICLFLSVMIFYNPERIPFERGKDVIVAPIDGVVKSIEHNQEKGIKVVISSPPCFVGVLRCPFEGDIEIQKTSGLFFFSLKSEVAKRLNTFAQLNIQSVRGQLSLVYYPLFLSKSLKFFETESLEKGERLGFLPFGVVEFFLPASVHLKICEGDKIKGAETTIGIFA